MGLRDRAITRVSPSYELDASLDRSGHACAAFHEQLHNLIVAICSCPLQRPGATCVHICAVLEEQLHNVRVAVLRC